MNDTLELDREDIFTPEELASYTLTGQTVTGDVIMSYFNRHEDNETISVYHHTWTGYYAVYSGTSDCIIQDQHRMFRLLKLIAYPDAI